MELKDTVRPFQYIEVPISELQINFLELSSKWGLELKKYKDEVETIRDLTMNKFKIRQDHWIELFEKLIVVYDETVTTDQNMAAANYYWEAVRLFNMDSEMNSLLVVHLLTNAILHAKSDSKLIICTYIMRAKALFNIGFYRNSVEDCKIAANYLKVRNTTTCVEHVLALKLEDAASMEMESLVLHMEKQVAKRCRGDQISASTQKMLDEYSKIKKPGRTIINLDKVYFHNKKMIAKKLIKAGDNIISEPPFALYAYGDNPVKICSNCGCMHLVPYPCHKCHSGMVVYCSSECRKLHEIKHAYECEFFKLNMHKMVSIEAVLAMRTTIYGLIEMAPFLTNKITAKNMWSCMFGSFYQDDKTPYSRFLKLGVHIKGKRNLDERLRQCLEAEFLITFLLNRTLLFTLLSRTQAKKDELKIFLTAVLIFNVQQIKSHARGMITVLDFNSRDHPERRFIKSAGITIGSLSDKNRNVTQLAIAIYPQVGRCRSDPNILMAMSQENYSFFEMYAVNDVRRGDEIIELSYIVQNPDIKTKAWIKREFEMIRTLLHPAIGGLPMEKICMNRLLVIGTKALMKVKSIYGHLTPMFVKHMLYVWDIIALGKIPIDAQFMKTCLEALQVMSNFEQDYIMGYFRKYLLHLLTSPIEGL